MDIPSPCSGVVQQLLFSVGDRVKQDDAFAHVQGRGAEPEALATVKQMSSSSHRVVDVTHLPEAPSPLPSAAGYELPSGSAVSPPSARIVGSKPQTRQLAQSGPASRRLARELGIDITQVTGTGRRERILKADVKAYVKALVTQIKPGLSPISELSSLPDIAKYGSIRREDFSKFERVTSQNMQRAWREIPHAWLQQFIDITELDQERMRLKAEVEGLTITALIIKALGLTLGNFPRFNSAVDAQRMQIVYREYLDIGVAVDTTRGLVVAVIRDVDRLSVAKIGQELIRLSELARAGELQVSDMKGASMTLSSLGGLGIDGLQPMVNWPEVAILGAAKATIQPVYNGTSFEPKLMLPVTLGFDHRVINGADGASFLSHLKYLLNDPKRLLVAS